MTKVNMPSGTKVNLSDVYFIGASSTIQRVELMKTKKEAMLLRNPRGQQVLIDFETFLEMAEIAQDYLQELYNEKDANSKH